MVDEFWEIQLDNNRFHTCSLSSASDCDDRVDSDSFNEVSGSADIDGGIEGKTAPTSSSKLVYSLPWEAGGNANAGCVTLKLHSLPTWADSFSPLGADPWYGSALLASLFLCDCRTDIGSINSVQQHIRSFTRKVPLRVIELGSGAVGLSAFAAALFILRHRADCESLLEGIIDEVVLSDNDPEVLEQLKNNTKVASAAFDERATVESLKNRVPNMRVHTLDWGDDSHEIDLAPFHLAIGAELVYTLSTAVACVKVVEKLLFCNRDILIVIVQVGNREGWRDTFLPKLEAIGAFVVTEELPIEIHQQATKYVEQGGTLNALKDFEVCFISRIDSI